MITRYHLLLLLLVGPVCSSVPFGARELQVVSARITAQSQLKQLGTLTPIDEGTGNLTGFVCPSNNGATFSNYLSSPYAPISLTCLPGYYHNGGTQHAWRVTVKCSATYDATQFPYDFTASTPCVATTTPAASGLDPSCGVGATVGRPCFCNSNTWGFIYYPGSAKCLAW